MDQRLGRRAILPLGVLAVLVMVLVGCMAGVPQAAVDTLNRELEVQEMKVIVLEEKLAKAEEEAAVLARTVRAPEAEASGQPAQGTESGVTVLLGAVVETPAPPRPTPTEPPADAPTPTPAPPSQLPASYADPLPVYIYADTVTGSGSEYNVGPTSDTGKSVCAITGIFKRGMRIVWRFEAIDTSTGKRLGDADVESAIVRLPHGEELKARFGRHGRTEDAPWFWATVWDIPLDYPLGTLDWSIEVKTSDGKVGVFRQLQVYSDHSESRTQIVE